MTADHTTAILAGPRPSEPKHPGSPVFSSGPFRNGLSTRSGDGSINPASSRQNLLSGATLVLLCTVLLALAGCKSQESGQHAGKPGGTDSAPGQSLPASVPADFQLTLERTPCYGTCPIYELRVDAGGSVSLEAGKFMALKEGTYHKQLADSTVLTLYRRLERDSVWTFREHYDANISDVPSMILALTAGGQAHRINAREDYPDRFAKLFAFLEQRIGVKDTAGWTQAGEK